MINNNLKECFPKGREILKTLIKETDETLKKIDEFLKKVYLDENNSPDVKMFIREYAYAFYYKDLFDKNKRMKRELSMYEGKSNDLNVEAAKAIPIETLHDFAKVRKGSSRITCKCPFHDEKIPSFVIYKKNNSFHCFSCKSSGDSISFIMKIKQMDFIHAVKYLTAAGG